MQRSSKLERWSSGGFGTPLSRRLRLAGLGVLGIVALAWLGWLLAGLYVEWVWFENLGQLGVLVKRLLSQLALLVGGALVFLVLHVASLKLAKGHAAADGAPRSSEENMWAYLARVSANLSGDPATARRAERLLLLAGLGLAVLFGLGAADQRDLWLTASARRSFDLADPFFGRDASFYVFLLPLLRAVHGWLIGALLAIAAATIAAYLARARFQRGLNTRRALEELPRPARLHLAALGAAAFVLAAAHFQLALNEVVFANSGQAFGLAFPGYTAVNAQAPACWLASVASLVAALWLLWSAGRPPSRRLFVGPLLWLGALMVSWLYPLLVQALVVKPNEALLERPYLAHVMAVTRAAYGLDHLIERALPAEGVARPEIAQSHIETLSNLRLWEPEPLRLGLNQLQAGKPYYSFFLYPDLDRYTVDGERRPLLVAARELDPRALPARSWVNTRLQFTHGYGVVAAAANAVAPDGRPVLVERDIPPVGIMNLERPEIYFGERTTEPALVRTAEAEIDYPRGDENVRTRYEGLGGVSLGGALSRLAHAVRLADLNLLLSPAIGSESALLHRRQVADRVQHLAPFLLLDADPYPVVLGGRLVWVLDGYTHSNRFPLAPQVPARLLAAGPRSGETRRVEPNYLRGSVKATVDAFDGTVTLYQVDQHDPLVAAYARIYPSLLQPDEAMPAELRAHLRYPQQLFSVQADVLARFHVGDPAQLYSGEDAWLVALGRFDSRPNARPNYGLQRLPDETSEEFVLTIPYRPYSQANDRHNLVALLAARSDPPHYGELILYRYPRDRQVEGPFQAELRIDQDPTVSAQLGLWQRSGAQVIRGELQTIPLGSSVLYIESLFLQRSERAALPELQRVVAVLGGKVAMEPTVQAALENVFGAPLALDQGHSTPTADSVRPASARELAISAQEHLQRAQEALFAGDRAGHDRELQAALEDLQRLAELTK